jgi:SAM-dependent methyltransferase
VSGGIHEAAAEGFAVAGEEYERSRPDYPDEAVDRLVQEMEITPAAAVLDLGAGTGKLTRMLIPTRARVVAVEPVEGMWQVFRRVLAGVPVVAATAEALPFAEGSFDGVVVAQAFHWFEGDAALPEIGRVLKPAGRLGLLWNIRDESVPWVRRLTEIIHPYEKKAPRERTGTWREAFARSDLFGTLHQRRFQHRQRFDEEGLVVRVASTSFIARLAPGERSRVLEEVRTLARSVQEEQGEIQLPYITDLYWCSRG